MSLYQLSKLLYELNRSDAAKDEFKATPETFVSKFDLTEEEAEAILKGDFGKLYVLGVNGQILMHFAALLGVEWPDYIQGMRDAVVEHGPVRAGLYAMTTTQDEKVAGV